MVRLAYQSVLKVIMVDIEGQGSQYKAFLPDWKNRWENAWNNTRMKNPVKPVSLCKYDTHGRTQATFSGMQSNVFLLRNLDAFLTDNCPVFSPKADAVSVSTFAAVSMFRKVGHVEWVNTTSREASRRIASRSLEHEEGLVRSLYLRVKW